MPFCFFFFFLLLFFSFLFSLSLSLSLSTGQPLIRSSGVDAIIVSNDLARSILQSQTLLSFRMNNSSICLLPMCILSNDDY